MKLCRVLSVVHGALALICICCGSGCERAEHLSFVSSQGVVALPDELEQKVVTTVVEKSGTFHAPEMIAPPIGAPESKVLHERLAAGQAVYQMRCVQCHGVSGDGQGVAAKYMYPRPRDYRKGLFKFISTPYGARPTRDDLKRTIRLGVRGTSMPAFPLLSPQEIDAVAEYVVLLSQRGEFEEQLVLLAESEEDVDPEIVADETLPLVKNRWEQAEVGVVQPLTPQPQFTTEHVERGRKAFVEKGCVKCHGPDARGQTAENIGKDAWGETTRAADITSGMLHGGQRPLDLYRRIYSGINGTPMPAFGQSLASEPDTLWDLVAFVKSVSNGRRQGDMPPPGAIRPYLPEPSADSPDAAAADTP